MADEQPTVEATPEQIAEAQAVIAGLHPTAEGNLGIGQLALPKIVKATSSSSGKYVLGTDFTLVHIVNTADLTVIADIVNDSTEYVIGSGLIADLPLLT